MELGTCVQMPVRTLEKRGKYHILNQSTGQAQQMMKVIANFTKLVY